MLDVLVVDDEAPARDELKYLLGQEASVRLVGEAAGGAEALGLVARLKPQVVFLDIEMRGMNGLETAAAIRTVSPEVHIVFATAYDAYALRAFEIGAVDYILKPFERERVQSTVRRLEGYKGEDWRNAAERVDAALVQTRMQLRKLPLEREGKIVMVDYDKIVYAFSEGGSVAVLAEDGTYGFMGTLAELEQRLRGTALMRVHKSYLVNLDRVSEVIPWFKGTYWVKLHGLPDAEIPISKSQIKEVKELLGLR